jgi:hypothetical protein
VKTIIQTHENVPDSLVISRKLLKKPTVTEEKIAAKRGD